MNISEDGLSALAKMFHLWQASQRQINFEFSYRNPFCGCEEMSLKDFDDKEKRKVIDRAVKIFDEANPEYNSQRNLDTQALFERCIQDIKNNENLCRSKTIRLTNGCCNQSDCPTTVFMGCLLQEIMCEIYLD